jgi:hypothetical protein
VYWPCRASSHSEAYGFCCIEQPRIAHLRHANSRRHRRSDPDEMSSGLLDRVDSFLIVIPLVFYFLRLVGS